MRKTVLIVVFGVAFLVVASLVGLWRLYLDVGRTPAELLNQVEIAIQGDQLTRGVLAPVLAELGRDDVRVVPVVNEFFGGNTAVAGLMVGSDLARVLGTEPIGHRYLLPDVCLSKGVFLDGTRPEDLPRPVEVVPTNGIALREALMVGAPS